MIPNELNTHFDILLYEVYQLNYRFKIYTALFSTSEDTVTLLNKSGGEFFYYVQTGFLENIVLSISRITDPPSTLNNSNMTIFRLTEFVDDQVLKAELQTIENKDIKPATKNIRNWRKKIYAHKDLDQSLKYVAKLDALTIREIRLAIEAINKFLNAIRFHYCNSRILYDHIDNASKKIIFSLEEANKLKKYKHDLKLTDIPIPKELL